MLPHDVMHVILCLCEEANTPRAVTVAMMVRYGELDQLVSLDCDPLRYTSSNLLFRDRLVTDFIRKCQGLGLSRDLRAAAVQSFWKSEKKCYASNERLTPFLFGADGGRGSERIYDILSQARKYIASILGPCPSLPGGRHGPGATFADKGKFTTIPDKMSSTPTISSSALGLLPTWGRTAWARAVSEEGGEIQVVRGNRFTTAPKDSEKDRGICIEPSLNIFYQLGYGSEIRSRLFDIGIDLINGQSRHKDAARSGSLTGALATIDLSSASDTICSVLVELLLPPTWFQALKSLRSNLTFIDNRWVRLEKFSSMGNGYTFELETLIFLGLSHAVLSARGTDFTVGVNLLVYGDDIIIPSEGYEDVVGALRFFGFDLNPKKCFSRGSFRESCGGDFFDGRSVRSFFLKKLPNEPQDWISIANGLRRVVKDHHHHDGDSLVAFRAWRSVLHCIPRHIRDLRGPETLGDIVVHDHSSRWSPESRERTGRRWRTLGVFDPASGDGIRYFKAWVPISSRRIEWNHFRPSVQLASALLFVGDGTLGVTPRDAVTGFGVRWVSSS